MSLINLANREINCKIVYYGIGLSGKTTNLHFIHQALNPHDVGRMVSIETEYERTLYFDLLPLELGKVHRFTLRFQLYTVPGQILYQQTRISVLKGADCVIFVADSQASKFQENIECWNELQEQLRCMKKDVGQFPLVLQWNKRDLQNTLPVSVLEKYLNPYRVPSFEAVAVTGKGVIESLRIGINSTLRKLERRWLLHHTPFGLSVRASIQHRTAAQLVGIDVDAVATKSFGIGVAMAAAGGSIFGALNAFNPASSYDLISRLLVIIVLGGMGSLRGAFLGAVLMLVISDVTAVIWSPLWSSTVFFGCLILLLVLRPEGLFVHAGRKQ